VGVFFKALLAEGQGVRLDAQYGVVGLLGFRQIGDVHVTLLVDIEESAEEPSGAFIVEELI
jgi:hypothetical protein